MGTGVGSGERQVWQVTAEESDLPWRGTEPTKHGLHLRDLTLLDRRPGTLGIVQQVVRGRRPAQHMLGSPRGHLAGVSGVFSLDPTPGVALGMYPQGLKSHLAGTEFQHIPLDRVPTHTRVWGACLSVAFHDPPCTLTAVPGSMSPSQVGKEERCGLRFGLTPDRLDAEVPSREEEEGESSPCLRGHAAILLLLASHCFGPHPCTCLPHVLETPHLTTSMCAPTPGAGPCGRVRSWQPTGWCSHKSSGQCRGMS